MSLETRWDTLDTPIGSLRLEASPAGLRAVAFPGEGAPPPARARGGDGALALARAELEAYFAGTLRAFTVALDLPGTPLQRAVWRALGAVGFGETTTYGTLAARVGRPRAVRAVGAAVGRTPAPIVVPCHRVVGADGSLTGYRGGLERKRALLALEGGEAPPPR